MTPKERRRLNSITDKLRQILKGEPVRDLDTESEEDPTIKEMVRAVKHISAEFQAISKAARDLSQGDLEGEIQAQSPPAQSLKAFQATARHLLWQTDQMAKGDFSQKVDFLGDFSDSFNAMISQLRENRSKIEEQLAELERLAVTDSLTQTKNRRYFVDTVEEELKRLRRYRQTLSIIILDVDHFKNVNDTHGHSAGDKALKAISDCCTAQLREVDVFARIGGEEFAVIMPATDLEEATTTAGRLRSEIEELKILDKFSVTASFGVAQANDEDSVDTLFGRADHALYRAKRRGRNRVETQ